MPIIPDSEFPSGPPGQLGRNIDADAERRYHEDLVNREKYLIKREAKVMDMLKELKFKLENEGEGSDSAASTSDKE